MKLTLLACRLIFLAIDGASGDRLKADCSALLRAEDARGPLNDAVPAVVVAVNWPVIPRTSATCYRCLCDTGV